MNELGETMADAVVLTRHDGIAEIRLNRPERRNVLDVEMVDALGGAIAEVVEAKDTRVVVFSAEGSSFGAGGDLDYFRRAEDKPAAAERLIRPLHEMLKRLDAAPFITIGSIKGAVAGGSLSLALGFDMLIAAEDTVFNFAYPRVGVPADCGGSWALPRLVGYRKALEIALLCQSIRADEALRLGLVNRIVPLDALEAETMALARQLAEGAPAAQAHVKALMRRSLDNDYAAQLDAEKAAFVACAGTGDFSEALEAFFGKRRPRFAGK